MDDLARRSTNMTLLTEGGQPHASVYKHDFPDGVWTAPRDRSTNMTPLTECGQPHASVYIMEPLPGFEPKNVETPEHMTGRTFLHTSQKKFTRW